MEFYPPGTGPDSEAVECVLRNGYVGYCRTAARRSRAEQGLPPTITVQVPK